MVFNTATVGAAVTPTIIETWFAHYLNRSPRKGKPTAHLSYDAALHLIRQFLVYSSHHTVEDVQAFTQQWVPTPSWVKTEDVLIPESYISTAVQHLHTQLGVQGLEQIGGRYWWQWRRDHTPLKGEWIEMKKDADLRKKKGNKCQRSMLYIHGGAYYFGSVGEHRYQIQRHARKLQARVFAPRYRLAPQFPFPCGLLDCLAAYLFMLETQPPETIILAGDSAGGGMALALLVVLRDQGLPLPAGSVLISPWCDLTHSFPSVATESEFDYIPPCGFHHRPSPSWPPPNSDDLRALEEIRAKHGPTKDVSVAELKSEMSAQNASNANDAAGYSVTHSNEKVDSATPQPAAAPGEAANLSIKIDGKEIELKDQIQMYAHNAILSHPLVSPVLQPSLGGLPPMLVSVGGGEMLRDEQIYLAHKVANPSAYPPPATKYADQATIDAAIAKYPPTKVQLQVWDDLCHVACTLSFTRPAKYQYRSIAQFGAWALAAAQGSEIGILDDDEISEIGSDSEDESEQRVKGTREERRKIYQDAVDVDRPSVDGAAASSTSAPKRTASALSLGTSIGKAGDPLPPFHKNMIRQRVTRHGDIYPLAPAKALEACNMAPSEIGTIKPGPVRKWLAAHDEGNRRFAGIKRKVQLQRLKEMRESQQDAVFHETFPQGTSDKPPPTAMAGRHRDELPKPTKQRESKGLAMWVGMQSKHDEQAIEKEQQKEDNKQHVTMSVAQGTPHPDASGEEVMGTKEELDAQLARSAQAAAPSGTAAMDMSVANAAPVAAASTAAVTAPLLQVASTTRAQTTNGATVPFKIRPALAERNPSTMTLESTMAKPSTTEGSLRETEPAGSAAASTTASERRVPTSDGAADGSLQRQMTTRGWARSVLSRAGIGSLKRTTTPAASGNAAPPVPSVGLAVQNGEVVDADKRPEPTRFVTAPSLEQ